MKQLFKGAENTIHADNTRPGTWTMIDALSNTTIATRNIIKPIFPRKHRHTNQKFSMCHNVKESRSLDGEKNELLKTEESPGPMPPQNATRETPKTLTDRELTPSIYLQNYEKKLTIPSKKGTI